MGTDAYYLAERTEKRAKEYTNERIRELEERLARIEKIMGVKWQ